MELASAVAAELEPGAALAVEELDTCKREAELVAGKVEVPALETDEEARSEVEEYSDEDANDSDAEDPADSDTKPAVDEAEAAWLDAAVELADELKDCAASSDEPLATLELAVGAEGSAELEATVELAIAVEAAVEPEVPTGSGATNWGGSSTNSTEA